MSRRLLREIRLRNLYQVYELDDGSYSVVNTDGRETRHEQAIKREVAEWLGDALSGGTVDKDEAADLLTDVAKEMGLPYTRGWQLGYYAQRVLLVLVARDEASFRRKGQRFLYTVI
jgi:hypothetical protein